MPRSSFTCFSTFLDLTLSSNCVFYMFSYVALLFQLYLPVIYHFPWVLYVFRVFSLICYAITKNRVLIMSHCFQGLLFFIIVFHWFCIRLNPVQFILIGLHLKQGPHQRVFSTSWPSGKLLRRIAHMYISMYLHIYKRYIYITWTYVYRDISTFVHAHMQAFFECARCTSLFSIFLVRDV